jgi:hypothetical protein
MTEFKSYDSAVEDTWRHTWNLSTGNSSSVRDRQQPNQDEIQDIIRYATLTPSSHNTQCWKFRVTHDSNGTTIITVLPDFDRRCPMVDPDDHHLYVTLGCAVENMVIAAKAYGWDNMVHCSDPSRGISVRFLPGDSQTTSLFEAIPMRHTNRSEYDGKLLPPAEIAMLEAAGTGLGVHAILLTNQASKNIVTEYVIKGNTSQLANKEWVSELQNWVRFNEDDVLENCDGLYGKSTGNPTIPRFLGRLLFPYLLNANTSNNPYAKQIESSAGVAVFLTERDTPLQWVNVGRCFERFALQATALGICTAHLNQPVEEAHLCPEFMKALHLDKKYARADLIVRFGRGQQEMPPSLRRPIGDVLVE